MFIAPVEFLCWGGGRLKEKQKNDFERSEKNFSLFLIFDN